MKILSSEECQNIKGGQNNLTEVTQRDGAVTRFKKKITSLKQV